MTLQLTFEQPLYISYSKADLVVINFADEELFLS